MSLTVEYDYENRKIRIDVRVDSKLNVLTPPVAIPQGEWELRWELDEESGHYAQFNQPGIQKVDSGCVQRFTLQCKAEEMTALCCLAAGNNYVEQPNGCPIYLYFLPHNNGKPFKHDPTIAVTLDPVDGRSIRCPGR